MRNPAKSLKDYARENGLDYLIKEYSADNTLPADQIGHNSTTPVKWVCEFGHETVEPPFKYVRRGYCPVCGKHRKGSFAQVYPNLLKYWSNENEVDPYSIPPTYSKPIKWKCENDHNWERKIPLQAKILTCPHCKSEEGKFFAAHPEMRDQWDSYRNGNVDPESIPAYSNEKFFWMCPNGHSYQAAPEKLMRRKSRCPVCSSFGFTRPDLIEEWNLEKNQDKTPYDYPAKSKYVAWFTCPFCKEEYTARIANRVEVGPGCPKCRKDR